MWEATWTVASFHSTSLPFIQIVPVPGNAIRELLTYRFYGKLVSCWVGEFVNPATALVFTKSPIHQATNSYCASPQNGQRCERACSGLRQCQQKRGCGAS